MLVRYANPVTKFPIACACSFGVISSDKKQDDVEFIDLSFLHPSGLSPTYRRQQPKIAESTETIITASRFSKALGSIMLLMVDSISSFCRFRPSRRHENYNSQ